jgi:hypothetical protein
LQDIREKIDYLSGWIAGDGSVTRDRTRARIEIWCKSEVMVSWFEDVFNEIDIASKRFIEKNKNEHIIRFGKKKDVLEFSRKISIPHPKKQRRLISLLR